MPFTSGENVGPYRVVEQLGQGGMASVYKAYHPALDRYVAIKVLHPAFLEDPNFLARFQREARVVAKLEHPNIVSIYDFAEHEGQPYLVMKFIEGRTLKSVLADARLSLRVGRHIVEAVGAGLGYAHRQGILHRDIKPSNVLLGEDRGIYLADFGLARIAQAGESTLSGDMLLGTPQYISPEQARGEEDLDEGTDIYSLGVVLYEMVVGQVPFNADTPFSIIHDHIYTPLPMPRRINPQVSEPLEKVLLKALAKEREDRYESVDGLVSAFGEAVEAAGKPAAVETVAPREVESELVERAVEESEASASPRRRWLWVAGGAALACLCLFVFLVAAGNQEERAEAEAATATALVMESPAPGQTDLPTRQIDDPRVQAARTAVAEDPDNPESRLELAESLEAAGFGRLAVTQRRTAAELYLKEGAHVEAAKALVAILEMEEPEGKIDRRLEAMMSQSLFLAATSPQETSPLVETVRQQYPGWDALPAIGHRIAIYDGRLAEALPRLEDRVDQHPDDLLGRAALAEAFLLDGRPEQASELARETQGRPGVPEWLSQHLSKLIERSEET